MVSSEFDYDSFVSSMENHSLKPCRFFFDALEGHSISYHIIGADFSYVVSEADFFKCLFNVFCLCLPYSGSVDLIVNECPF